MRMNPYRERLTINGTSHRERMVYAAQDFANRHAPESIAYKEIKIDGKQENALIISTNAVNEKIIRMLPGHSFLVGQIVEWRDSYWLITEKDNDDDVTTRGRIEQCNAGDRFRYVLYFFDSILQTAVISVPCRRARPPPWEPGTSWT